VLPAQAGNNRGSWKLGLVAGVQYCSLTGSGSMSKCTHSTDSSDKADNDCMITFLQGRTVHTAPRLHSLSLQ
jgi:hypothetical protein